MKITLKHWIILGIGSIISIFVWLAFIYPQLAFINFSINRSEALSIANEYIATQNPEAQSFKTAIVFNKEGRANQYLQKTLGFENFISFTEEHDFDVFFWLVRFFKEETKEEYRLTISSATGQITSFAHTIKDSDSRKFIPKKVARLKAEEFLNKKFGTNLDEYTIKTNSEKKYDNRIEYKFTWQKNSVHIPWSDNPTVDGKGQLYTAVRISGDEILSYNKNKFSVPSAFRRYLSKKKDTGQNLTTLVRLFYYALFISALFFMISRKNDLAMHTTKRFYIYIAIISFLLSIFSNVNYFEEILFNYKTSGPFDSYIIRLVINHFTNSLFLSVGILIPFLAGELFCYKYFKDKPQMGFLTYINTTFLSRSVAQSIFIGYLVCLIMLGIQAAIIRFGQNHLGVWVEYNWLGSLSTAHFPYIAALTIGFKASIAEESLYRMFAIGWGKKLFKSTAIAVVVSSLIWGFAHSNYPIFPMWFRGLEVTIIGLFMCYAYLNFGIISVIVGHYLFDAFWNTSGYLFGSSTPVDYYSSILVLTFPLIFAMIAWFINKVVENKPLEWKLNKHQIFNVDILKFYLQKHPEIFQNDSIDNVKEKISNHGWDIAVVEAAVKDIPISTNSKEEK